MKWADYKDVHYKWFQCPNCLEPQVCDIYDSHALKLRAEVLRLYKENKDGIASLEASKEYTLKLKEEFCHPILTFLQQRHRGN